jgi:hypothetical protein
MSDEPTQPLEDFPLGRPSPSRRSSTNRHVNASLASSRIGGHDYPLVSQPNCKTCGSEHRQVIERALVAGRPPKAILKDLPVGHCLSARNLLDHLRRGHLPIRAVAVERMRETDAMDNGRVLHDGAVVLDETRAFLRLVVGRTVHRMMLGEIEPTVADGARAAKTLQDFAPEAGADTSTWQAVLQRMVEVLSRSLGPDEYQRVLLAMRDDEQLRRLDALLRQPQET